MASLVLVLFLGASAAVANANAFLGRSNQNVSFSLTAESEHALLSELETALGSGHRHATEKRLKQIEKIMSPMFAAMTKNEHGKLGSAAVGYMLHRVFVQRHGWFIKALEPAGNSHGAWDSSSPVSILESRVPEHVQSLFENRLGQHGLGLKEVAVLASSIEHLVHSEALHRTRLSYAASNFSQEDALSQEEALSVLEMYMSILLTGKHYSPDVSKKEITKAQKLYTNIEKIFPSWPVTKQWMTEVFHSVAPKRDYLYFGDVETVVSEIGERYGDYENIECQQFKDWLVAVEDKGVGGAGRVRMADFYGQALNNNKWQFSESVGYLRELGALDESDASNPRVIIPNYVQAQSNCIETSAYYSVCCQDECEGILGRLEGLVSAPEASPSTLISMIPMIASASMPSGRTLPRGCISAWMRSPNTMEGSFHSMGVSSRSGCTMLTQENAPSRMHQGPSPLRLSRTSLRMKLAIRPQQRRLKCSALLTKPQRERAGLLDPKLLFMRRVPCGQCTRTWLFGVLLKNLCKNRRPGSAAELLS